MDPKLWGPLMWPLLYDASYAADNAGLHHAPPLLSGEEMRKLVEALIHVMPCRYCRESLAEFSGTEPPPLLLLGNPALGTTYWVWRLREKVNNKLGVQGLDLDRFLARLTIWTSMSDASMLWDVLFLFAKACGDDDASRCEQLVQFVTSLSRLLAYHPRLSRAMEATLSCLSKEPSPIPCRDKYVLLRWLETCKRCYDLNL